jgi:sortase B
MKNNTMFGSLINYKEQDYYDKHKEMHLYTRNKKYKVKIFAGYSTTSESDIYSFPNTKDTNKKMIQEAFKKSTFISNIDVLDEDSIITLSTCSYNFENERYVILGILQEI